MKKIFRSLGAMVTLPRIALVAAALLAFTFLPTVAIAGTMIAGAGAGMILDELTEFCDATALSTAATGRALIGDVIDLGTARDIGNGRQLYLVISVDTTVLAAGGASTVSFELSSDAQAAIAVDASETIHVATAAIPKATLVAGYQLVIPIPPEAPVYERYIGIVQNVATNAVTAGKINAFLTLDPAGNKAYPDAL